jgi:hypothetical protein
MPPRLAAIAALIWLGLLAPLRAAVSGGVPWQVAHENATPAGAVA